MKKPKRAVVIVNLGSPDSSSIRDVRIYLKEFLSDPDVIDLPSWVRLLLVYGVIAPIRSFHSAKLYEKLLSDKGFPLVYHSIDLERCLHESLKDSMDVYLGMRYGNPSLKELCQNIKKSNYDELIILPLYPQYASSTTGSVIHLLQNELQGSPIFDRTLIIPQFHQDHKFIELWQNKVIAHHPSAYDAMIFSYHGIPIRQTQKAHPEQSCESLNCKNSYTDLNQYCYQAACYQTTRSIIAGLGINDDFAYTSFQSRFGRNWLSPHTDQVLAGLAKDGKKNVLVISPSFVADCLETTVEIEHEYQILFQKAGGEKLTLVPSLNSDPTWVSFIANLVSGHSSDTITLKSGL